MKKSVGSSSPFAGIVWSRLTPLAMAGAVVLGLSVLPSQTVVAQKNAAKVTVCHANGAGIFTALSVGANALPAHAAHGDGLPGGAVPDMPGYAFDASCTAVQSQPDFEPFFIRNHNSTISAPWDGDLVITENAAGDGFSATTPRSGQKVGYGTNFFDGLPINTIESVNWVQLAGLVGKYSYLNIWVTDGTNYAIIASEDDYRGEVFATRQEWKVHETDFGPGALDWLCESGSGSGTRGPVGHLRCGGVNATLADIPSNVTILSPPYFPWPKVGTGAPRGGYGFNLIFGDTQANFIGSYWLENLTITVDGVMYFAGN